MKLLARLGKLTGGTNKQPQMQAASLLFHGAANMQPFGLASSAPNGVPAVGIQMTDGRMAVWTGSGDDTPEAEMGSLILYAAAGQKITLATDGSIAITGALAVTIDGKAVAKIGDMVATPAGTGKIIGGV